MSLGLDALGLQALGLPPDSAGGGGATLSADIAESVSAADAAGADAVLQVAQADTLDVADVITAALSAGAAAAVAEGVDLSSALTAVAQIGAGLLEALAADDTTAALMAAGALQVEAAALGELLDSARDLAAQLLDAATLTDAATVREASTIGAGITEAAALADITGIRGIMITSQQAAEYLDKALGITVPAFILTASVARLNTRETALEAAGYDEPTLMLIQCMTVALIAAAGAPRRVSSQGAASGASRSFRYTDNDLSALRRSLAELDTAGVVADIIGPDPAGVATLMVLGC